MHQKETIRDLLKTPLKEGDTWYLISTTWFRKWKKYVGCLDAKSVGKPSAKLESIDNSSLFKDESQNILKENLTDESDYVLVPKEAWTTLVSWYGLAHGQQPIPRHVIQEDRVMEHLKVEVYFMKLKMCHYQQMDDICSYMFSHASTIRELEQKMRSVFQVVVTKPVRLLAKDMSNVFEELDTPANTLYDVGLHCNHMIVIEEQNDDGSWPRTGN